jgi:hypothetical protein
MHPDDEIANYETGARKYPMSRQDGPQEFDQKAAENKPRLPFGLAEPVDEPVEATNRSDGVQPPTRPAARKRKKSALRPPAEEPPVQPDS